MYGQIPGGNLPAGYESQEAAVRGHSEIGFSYQIIDRSIVYEVGPIYILHIEIVAIGTCSALAGLDTQVVIVSL
jgi:hypothetical protein